MKIVIVGDAGVGKSTFVNRLITGEFNSTYKPTVGVDVKKITLNNEVIELWDVAGEFRGLENGYFIGADAAIIMFDVMSKSSYLHVYDWHKKIKSVCENIPIVICGNKIDIIDRVVKSKMITYPNKHNLQYFDISTKSCYNFDKPLKHITNKIKNIPRSMI